MLHVNSVFKFVRFFSMMVVVQTIFLIAVESSQAAPSCRNLFSAKLVDDLQSHYESEIKNLAVKEIQALNLKMINELNSTIPERNEPRAQSMPLKSGKSLLQLTDNHYVVSPSSTSRYEHPETSTGYCFGRATYIHMMALKMGLQRDSIKKIWAVGPMKAGNINWGFHVATVVYTREAGWQVIATNFSSPQSIKAWTQKYADLSVDKKLRFYATEADKFALTSGTYSAFQMGLTLPRKEDWYLGYFTDMRYALRNETLASLGLQKINASESYVDDKTAYKASRVAENFTEKLIDAIWGL